MTFFTKYTIIDVMFDRVLNTPMIIVVSLLHNILLNLKGTATSVKIELTIKTNSPVKEISNVKSEMERCDTKHFDWEYLCDEGWSPAKEGEYIVMVAIFTLPDRRLLHFSRRR